MTSRSLNMSISDARHKDKYISCLNRLGKVMDVVQSQDFNVKKQEKIKDKLLDEVLKNYNESGLKIFSETLFRMMIVPFQAKENPYVVAVIDFFHTIICDDRWSGNSPDNSPNDTVNTLNGSIIEDGTSEPLPMRILRLCERYHPDARAMVRLRIMQTVAKIIPSRLQVNQMGKSLQARVIRMLVTRLKDKSEQVRSISAENLCEFVDEELPFQKLVLDGLIESMKYDPAYGVREKIVSHLKILDDTTEYIVERSGDQNSLVRAAAIVRVSENIKLTDLTVEMREAILKANITDETPKNVEKAIGSLLESWLNCLKGDTCEFLRVLNVRRRANLCEKALNALYNQPAEDAFEKMSAGLLNEKKYPDESLCIESTYLWLYLYKRFKDEPYVYNKLALPVNEMIDYITEYVEVVEEEGDLPLGDLEYRSWMLGDLLQILAFLPIEEGERKAVLEFLPSLCLKKKLMDERNSTFVVRLISVCSNIDDENNIIDLVNCILDSDKPSMTKSGYKSKTATPSVSNSGVEDSLDGPSSLKIEVHELGNLMHKVKKLERDRDLAVKQNQLENAQELQDAINLLEGQVQKVKESIHVQANHCLNSSEVDGDNDALDDEEQWTFSNKTLLIVLSLVKTNVLIRDRISDFSRTFYEMYAVKALSKSRDLGVRALALELMCIVSLDFEEEVSKTTLYCLMALLRDNLRVKVTALKCLYDLALRYSFAKLGGFPQVQSVLLGTNINKDIPKVQINADDPASTLKSLLLSYIRHDEVRLVKVSVAGVLKLLFKKEMNSSRLITTFLINWAIPSQDAQTRFKDVGTMIPVYANMGENEAIEVAQCLLSCIKKTLMKIHSRAQGDELTPHPDIEKIVNLIVKCTDPSRLKDFQRSYIAHETIATGVLQELRDTDLTTEEKMHYAKLLKILDLHLCSAESLNQMSHTLSEIAETTNRTISQLLSGFATYLESLIENEQESAEEYTRNVLRQGNATYSAQNLGAFDNERSDNENMDIP